jgi:hypothetical protein
MCQARLRLELPPRRRISTAFIYAPEWYSKGEEVESKGSVRLKNSKTGEETKHITTWDFDEALQIATLHYKTRQTAQLVLLA